MKFTSHTRLPTVEEVFAWWDQYEMLDNIRSHSLMVRDVALLLAGWLVEKGMVLNRDAVEIGALVHDIAKTPCLTSGKLHATEGGKILDQLGYPQLAFLVRHHVVIPEGHPLDETMVVNYSDKRVTHDQIVDLESRYQYIMERYGNGDPERIARIEVGSKRMREVETNLFRTIGGGRSPNSLRQILGGC